MERINIKSLLVIGFSLFFALVSYKANASLASDSYLPANYQIDILGKHYQINKVVGIDAGWVRLVMQEGHNTNDNLTEHLTSVGAQLTWKI